MDSAAIGGARAPPAPPLPSSLQAAYNDFINLKILSVYLSLIEVFYC
jgi:hypothetical protein